MSAPTPANAKGPNLRPIRKWHFADCEFDDWTRQLIVRGKPATLEAKPLQVLEHLLESPGKVFRKEDLKDAVWGAETVDESLTTAIFKLRNAIGPPREGVIQTVHGIGYRFIAQVECTESEPSGRRRLDFHVDDPVPGYADEKWRLQEPLNGSGVFVWLAHHRQTQEGHVFKFADDDSSRDSLAHELAVVRHLRRQVGQGAPAVAVHGCQLEKFPYFLESEYGGPDLRQWAEKQVQMEGVSLAERLELAAAIIDAVEAAHQGGILHNNLRPEHILISPTGVGNREGWRVRLCNFSLSTLTHGEQANTDDKPGDAGENRTGDFAFLAAGSLTIKVRLAGKAKVETTYLAEELRSGEAEPSVLTDVYSLGVILYQLVCGDLNERPSLGWELRIGDELLREDIAAAASGDPLHRIASARALANRIRNLDGRHDERRQRQELADRAVRAERSLADSRARRPWIIAAVGMLCLGLTASLWFYRSAVEERNAAEATNKFLTDDLLVLNNPFHKKTDLNITLQSAIQKAASDIDQRFANQPLIAGRLHLTIAGAFDIRFLYPAAEQEYESAARDFQRAEGAGSHDAAMAILRECLMWGRSVLPGSIDRARDRLAKEKEVLAGSLGHDREVQAWELADEAIIALQTNQMKDAKEKIQQAVSLTSGSQSIEASSRVVILEASALIALRTGDSEKLEKIVRARISAIQAAEGSESTALLLPGLQLEEALFLEGKCAASVRQADEIFPRFVSTLGRDHDLTLQVIGTKAAAEGTMGRLDDSIRDDLANYQIAYKKDPHSFFAMGTLTDVANTEAKKKDWINCVRYARKSWEAVSQETGAIPGLKHGTAEVLAACLIENGKQRDASKLNDAEQLLKTVSASMVAGQSGDPGSLVDLPLLNGYLAFARGQYSICRKYATEAELQLKKLPKADPERVAALREFQRELAHKI